MGTAFSSRAGELMFEAKGWEGKGSWSRGNMSGAYFWCVCSGRSAIARILCWVRVLVHGG